MTLDYGLLATLVNGVSIIGLDWIVAIIIVAITVFFITREPEDMTALILPILVGYAVLGLRSNIVVWVLAFVLFVLNGLGNRGLANPLKVLKIGTEVTRRGVRTGIQATGTALNFHKDVRQQGGYYGGGFGPTVKDRLSRVKDKIPQAKEGVYNWAMGENRQMPKSPDEDYVNKLRAKFTEFELQKGASATQPERDRIARTFRINWLKKKLKKVM